MKFKSASRLVDDVVREIYLSVALQEPAYSPASDATPPWRRRPKTGPPLGWIRLTHVSRQWRQVGIDIAALWANVVCVYESDHAVSTAIQRARSCPYTIQLVWKAATKRRCEIAAQILPRVSSLNYMPDPENMFKWPMARHLSGKELPLLKYLSIQASFGDGEVMSEPLSAPSLQRCALSLDLPIVAPNLLRLTYDGTTRITLSRILTRLAGFSNLVKLYLCTVPHITDAETLPGPVHLPSLRYLLCNGNSYTGNTHLLEQVQVPSTTSMFITVGPEDYEDEPDVCARLLQPLRTQLLHPSRTTLRIAPDPVHQFLVQVHAPEHPVPVYGPGDIDLRTANGIVIDACATPLHYILSPLSTIVGSNITTIDIKMLNIPWTDVLTTTLQPLRAVVELHIWGRSRGILEALAPALGSAASSPDISLPSLKSLVVNAGDGPDSCDGEVWDEDDDETAICRHIPGEFGAGWLADLVPILQARARAGSPILRLKITGPLDCRGVLNETRQETCARVAVADIQALRGCVTEFVDARA